MDIATSVGSFALVVALLTVTPGLDTALILRTSLVAGRRPAWGVVLGIQLGTLAWGLLTAVGLSALLAASQVGYEVLRWAGAVYLVWMGLRMLLARGDAPGEEEARQEVRFRTGFRRGLVTNLLNPKVGAFYVAMLPQFIPQEAPHAVMGLLLAGVHVGEGLAVERRADRVRGPDEQNPCARRPSAGCSTRITGVVIVGFGVRLAVD